MKGVGCEWPSDFYPSTGAVVLVPGSCGKPMVGGCFTCGTAYCSEHYQLHECPGDKPTNDERKERIRNSILKFDEPGTKQTWDLKSQPGDRVRMRGHRGRKGRPG